jgi:hypothetical protein
MRRLAGVIVLVVVFVVGALWSFVPHLTEERAVVASTPSLAGFISTSEILVRRGQRACIAPVPLEPAIRRVAMTLHARGPQASPLELELRGPGYRGSGRFTGYDPGRAVGVLADVSPAPPANVDGTLCLRNAGRRAVGLVGTAEPVSISLPATTLDGKPAGDTDPQITFLDGPPRTMLSRAGTILGRASDLTGGYVPLWLLWPLSIAFVLGAPAALAFVFYRATVSPRSESAPAPPRP